MAEVVLQQAVIMLILIAVGGVCYQLKLLSKHTVSQISAFVLKAVNPIVILMSFQRDFDRELVGNLGWTFLLSIVSFGIAFGVSYLCVRKKEGRDTVIERFSSVYSNCAFMGIPLVQAMFGYEGVFYLTAYIAAFNAFVWSHGVMQMSGKRSIKALLKVLRSPSIIAIVLGLVMFFTRLTLPVLPISDGVSPWLRWVLVFLGLVRESFELVGSLNTPLAMMVAGATIVQTNLLGVLKKPRVFYVCFLRLLLIPVLTLLIFLLFPAERIVAMTVLAAASAPCAAICTMMSLQYKRNAAYASEIFGISTLLSVGTMPLMMILYELLSPRL